MTPQLRERAKKPRIAVLATGSPSSEKGGAERFYVGLRDALIEGGADASIHWEISDESSFPAILQSYLRFYDCDLSEYDGVISTKAPGYAIRHRNHVCYLQHTMRVFYDMFEQEFKNPDAELRAQRQLIQTLDTAALQPPRTKKVFAIGEEVRLRLDQYNNIASEVLHQGTSMRGFYCAGARYFFLPGRLHRWKRVNLAIEAMRHIKEPVELLISGTGEDEDAFRALAGRDRRIRFLGRLSDAELIRTYANALAVLFVPLREDFGLVTQEAFLSRKPVVTCIDSGEPARLVRDGVTGFVVSPDPTSLAAAMSTLASQPYRARAMGRQGRLDIDAHSWSKVSDALLAALGFASRAATEIQR
jgi:glycosyltransferase involved in cell wall biosynthesis